MKQAMISAEEASDVSLKMMHEKIEQERTHLNSQREKLMEIIYDSIAEESAKGLFVAVFKYLPLIDKGFYPSMSYDARYNTCRVTEHEGREHISDFYKDIIRELRDKGFGVRLDGGFKGIHLIVGWYPKPEKKLNWFTKLLGRKNK